MYNNYIATGRFIFMKYPIIAVVLAVFFLVVSYIVISSSTVVTVFTTSHTQQQVVTATDMDTGIWTQKIEVAAGDAYQGPWRMNESDFRYVDAPSVDINNNGVTGITWIDQSHKNVLFQIFEPDGEKRFSDPVNVSRSPDIFSWLPRVVISEDDVNNVYILWQEIVFSGGSHGGEIFFARSTDGGQTFSNPVNLSNTPAGAAKGRLTAWYWDNGSLDIVKAHDGTLYIAWTEYEGRLWLSYSTDRGDSFAEPVHVAGDNNEPARGPSIAAGDDNIVFLAWTVGEDRSADIHLVQSDDGGRSFGEPRVVFNSEGHSDAPKILVDDNGTLHLVYAESPAGPFNRYQIRYSRSDDGGNSFEGSREIAQALSDDFDSMNFPSIAADANNNIYILWELYPDRQNRPLGLGFIYSEDGGETFKSPSVIPGTDDPALGFNGSLQGLLMRKLAVNDTGEIAVVNNTFRQNQGSHVWLFRGSVRQNDLGQNY